MDRLKEIFKYIRQDGDEQSHWLKRLVEVFRGHLVPAVNAVDRQAAVLGWQAMTFLYLLTSLASLLLAAVVVARIAGAWMFVPRHGRLLPESFPIPTRVAPFSPLGATQA